MVTTKSLRWIALFTIFVPTTTVSESLRLSSDVPLDCYEFSIEHPG